MPLKEDVAKLTPKQRRYFLLRVSDMDVETSRKLASVRLGTYNSWLHQPLFVEIHRKRDEYAVSSKEEAIRLLRRDNQLSAVLLEEKIILRLKEEIDSGEYNLLRTNLAKEVYTKLISDLDVIPGTPTISWEQRVQNLFMQPQQNPVQIAEGEIIEAEIQETPQQILIETTKESS